MAAYATADDVRSAVARNPFPGKRSTAALDDTQLEASIADAQAEVDGWLRQRYTVPFPAPLPALVFSLTVDIAVYLAALTYYQESEILDTDPVARRYMRARELLKDIAEGSIDLDAGDGGGPDPSDVASVGAPVNPYDGVMFDLCDFGLGYRSWQGWC